MQTRIRLDKSVHFKIFKKVVNPAISGNVFHLCAIDGTTMSATPFSALFVVVNSPPNTFYFKNSFLPIEALIIVAKKTPCH